MFWSLWLQRFVEFDLITEVRYQATLWGMRHLLQALDGRRQRSLQQADEGASCQRSGPSIRKMEGETSRIIPGDHSPDKAGRCTRSNFTTKPEPMSFLNGKGLLNAGLPGKQSKSQNSDFSPVFASATISLATTWHLPRACFLNDICKLSGSNPYYRKSPAAKCTPSAAGLMQSLAAKAHFRCRCLSRDLLDGEHQLQ